MKDDQDSENRRDYEAFCAEYGFSEAEVQAITQNKADQIPMPDGFCAIRLAQSDLHGMGMFAATDVLTGGILAPARLGVKRTPAGRYTNHAKRPNCVFIPHSNGDIFLVAAEDIPCGTELTVDYRQAGRVNGNNRPKAT